MPANMKKAGMKYQEGGGLTMRELMSESEAKKILGSTKNKAQTKGSGKRVKMKGKAGKKTIKVTPPKIEMKAYGGSKKHNLVMEEGGSLKPIPSDNKGLPKLPKAVRNNMGYMKHGGMKKMMGVPGMYQEGGDMTPEQVRQMQMQNKEKAEAAMNKVTPSSEMLSAGKFSERQGSKPPIPGSATELMDVTNEKGTFKQGVYDTPTNFPFSKPAVPSTGADTTNTKMAGIPGMYAGGSMTTDSAKNMMGMRKKGGKFPDLTGDGKVTRADILKGRGVI